MFENEISQNDVHKILVGLGIAASVVGLIWLWARRKSNQFGSIQLKELPPIEGLPYLPLEDPEIFVLRLVSPTGQILDISFTPDEMKMMEQVASLSGEPMEKVIVDTALSRRNNI